MTSNRLLSNAESAICAVDVLLEQTDISPLRAKILSCDGKNTK